MTDLIQYLGRPFGSGEASLMAQECKAGSIEIAITPSANGNNKRSDPISSAFACLLASQRFWMISTRT